MGLKRTDEFRQDAVRTALTSGLTRTVHGHHAHPDARHEARLAHLDLCDVLGANIE